MENEVETLVTENEVCDGVEAETDVGIVGMEKVVVKEGWYRNEDENARATVDVDLVTMKRKLWHCGSLARPHGPNEKETRLATSREALCWCRTLREMSYDAGKPIGHLDEECSSSWIVK